MKHAAAGLSISDSHITAKIWTRQLNSLGRERADDRKQVLKRGKRNGERRILFHYADYLFQSKASGDK